MIYYYYACTVREKKNSTTTTLTLPYYPTLPPFPALPCTTIPSHYCTLLHVPYYPTTLPYLLPYYPITLHVPTGVLVLLVRVCALDVWRELVPSKIFNPPFPVLKSGHSVFYSCVCDVDRDWVNGVGFFLFFLNSPVWLGQNCVGGYVTELRRKRLILLHIFHCASSVMPIFLR